MASASIKDAGSGRWRIRWRERRRDADGSVASQGPRWRQGQHTVHGTRSDAERYRADVIDDLRLRGYHDPVEHAPKIAPPASLIDGLLAYLESSRRHGRRPSTIATHRYRVGILAEAIYAVTGLPTDEPLPVTVLERPLFDELIPVLEQRGATVPTRALGLLWRAWAWLAADPKSWPRVPVWPADPTDFVPERAPYEPTEAPSMGHADAALRHLRKRRARLDTVVVAIVQRYTGLRVGQVLGIERADLDLAAGTLVVRIGKSRREQAAMRTIPLSRHLLAEPLFKELLGRAPETGRIFRVRRIWRTIRVAWEAATEAGEVPVHVWMPPQRANARPDHAFRAALQGHLAGEKVPRDVIDHLVGHRGDMRSIHYGRDLAAAARAAVDGLPPVTWTWPPRAEEEEEEEKSENVIPLDSAREQAAGGS